MKRVYFLSYLEWVGEYPTGFNAGRCKSFEARTDAEAREIAAELLPERASWPFLRCVTERRVSL